MRIALLSFEYPPETGFGGIGTYTWFHARALARLGHDVHVLAGATLPGGVRHIEHDGVNVWRVRHGAFSNRAYEALGRLKWWWSRARLRNAIDMLGTLRELERTHAFDVVEMPESGAEGLFANRVTESPTVVRLHSPACLIMPFYDTTRGDRVMAWAMERFAMDGASAVSSSSGWLAREVRDQLGFVRPIDVIHNGIDVSWFDDAPQIDVRRAFSLPRDRPIALFVGRMEPRKGIQLVMQVIASLLERSDVAFVLAGDDLFGHVTNTLLPTLARRTLRGSVHPTGRLDPPSIRSLLSQADVVFLPSLWESCPYACLEAMAASRAIVASAVGGVPELIEDGQSGMLAPPGDTEAVVGALSELLADPCLRDRLGNNARRTVEARLLDSHAARRSIALYDRLRRS